MICLEGVGGLLRLYKTWDTAFLGGTNSGYTHTHTYEDKIEMSSWLKYNILDCLCSKV